MKEVNAADYENLADAFRVLLSGDGRVLPQGGRVIIPKGYVIKEAQALTFAGDTSFGFDLLEISKPSESCCLIGCRAKGDNGYGFHIGG